MPKTRTLGQHSSSATKRTTKTPAKDKREFVGWLPVASFTLTPKAAAAWLEDEAAQWSELLQLSLEQADREERRILSELALHLGDMTRAAALAVNRGKEVELDSMLDPRNDSSPGRIEPLALVLRAASRIRDTSTDDAFAAIRGPLAAIASAIIRAAREAEGARRKRRDAEREARHAARLATDLRYGAYMESVERFREAGKEAAAAGRAA